MTSNPFSLKYQLERNLRPFNRDEVRKLENGRIGLYTIWAPAESGGENEYIYTGMSRTCLRRRLMDHLRETETNPKLRNEVRLFRDVIKFSVAYTNTKEETRRLERSVIADWKPFTNRQV